MVTTAFTQTIPLKMNKDGVILVSKTRVTLDTIIAAFSEGASAEEISYQYPSVPLGDIYSVIGYYLRKKKQVDIYLKRREKLAFLSSRILPCQSYACSNAIQAGCIRSILLPLLAAK